MNGSTSDKFLYAVRNKKGLWFKNGRRYEDDNWVEDFQKARIYSRIGDARRTITCFMDDDDIANVVVFKVTEVRSIDDTERQEVRIDREEKKEKRKQLKKAKIKMEEAQREYQKQLSGV